MFQEEIGDLEKLILEIAIKIGTKKRIINLKNLFSACISQLDYSKEDIIRSIRILYQKKYLAERHRLTKVTVLNNEKRKRIYEYIKNNPGAHIRKIREIFNFGPYMAFRHLKYLEIFGLIRSKLFMNKKAYFLENFNENQDEKILVLKNETTKLIFDQIFLLKKVRLSEIEKNLDLDHGQIKYHINKLLEFNLIKSIRENDITFYTLPELLPSNI